MESDSNSLEKGRDPLLRSTVMVVGWRSQKIRSPASYVPNPLRMALCTSCTMSFLRTNSTLPKDARTALATARASS